MIDIKFFNSKVTPKYLSKVILLFMFLLIISLFYPVKEVFQGDWILQQSVILSDINTIKLFNFFNIHSANIAIRYYSILIFIGFIFGFYLSIYLSKQLKLPAYIVDKLVVGIIVFGVLGARFLYVLSNWDYFIQNSVSIIEIYKGGLSILGGLIGSLLFVVYYTKRYNYSTWRVLDVLVPGLLVGQIIGRWGNLFNYEAYGPQTNVFWKMFVPDTAVNMNKYTNAFGNFYHPTFLYESIANIFLLVFILYNFTRLTTRKSGLVFSIYLVGYGFIRSFLELYRLDALQCDLSYKLDIIPKYIEDFSRIVFPAEYLKAFLENIAINNINISQIISLLMLITGILIYTKRKRVVSVD